MINNASLRNELIQVRAGTTLRLEAGAEIGGAFDELGTVEVFDTATVVLAGGQIGVGGGSSGQVMLYDDSRFVLESGTVGGDADSSGQVIAFNRSSIVLHGGQVGGSGAQSGLVGFFDEALGEVRGGRFGGGGAYSGLVLGFASSRVEVFACTSALPAGPVVDTSGLISAVAKDGAPLEVPFMREATAVITLVEDCHDDVDTDGDGVLDSVDQCVESDLRPTLWIFNVNTCIPNVIDGKPVNEEGCSLADLVNAMIDAASENARSRGEFLRAVARGLRQLKQDGLLPGRSLGHFQNCAARCNWNDARKRHRHHEHGERDSRHRR